MINLIPPEARTRIIKEYWFRVVTVWLFMVAVVGVTVAALLLPAYVLVTSQVRVHESSATEATEQAAASKILVDASTEASLIVGDSNAQSLLEVLDMVESEIVPGSIVVNGYSFVRAGVVLGEVKIEGVAATRLALASFRDELIMQPLIERVDLPISNLAKDKEISFSMTLILAAPTPAI
jgi:hypothetical protein